MNIYIILFICIIFLLSVAYTIYEITKAIKRPHDDYDKNYVGLLTDRLREKNIIDDGEYIAITIIDNGMYQPGIFKNEEN